MGEETLMGLELPALRGELGRRLVHASGSAIPALHVLGFITWEQVRIAFVILAAFTLVLETIRLSSGLDWFIYRHFTREYEKNNPAGYVLYMVSSAGVALVFEPHIAIPALLMLMLGDPISGSLSSDELRAVKRPQVLAAMFGICALIALPWLYDVPLAVALGALAGTVADGVKPRIRGYIIDDNLTIAPVAAVGIWVGIELQGLLF